MKTIFQQTELAFNHITIQDAITLLPVMDELAAKFREAQSKMNDLRLNGYDYTAEEAAEIEKNYFTLGNQLVVLTRLGFVTSSPDMVQFDIKDFPQADI